MGVIYSFWIWRKIKYSILILIQTCHSYWLHPSYKICERLHKLTSKCKNKLTLSPFSNGFNQLNITPLFSQSLAETKRKSVYIIVNKIWKNDNKQWKLQIRIERKILWNWNCNFILYQLFFTANEWTHPKYIYKGVSSTSKNEEDWSL